MIVANTKKNTKGFALLMSIVVTSLLLIISFIVINIALKQLVLANYAEESQYAFYNAESGVECALYWDLHGTNGTSFDSVASSNISCNNQTFSVGGVGLVNNFTFNLPRGCVAVTVTKSGINTTIDGRGYNTCTGSSARKLERGVTLTYSGTVTSSGTNHALAINGGVVSASSEYNSNYPASSAINGDRTGNTWGAGTGGWNDIDAGWFPDWLQVSFPSASLTKIDVYTLANCFGACGTIDTSTSASTYGITDFQVQYDNGSGWTLVPGGNVTNNNKALVELTFTAIAGVTAIRVVVTNAPASFSRIVELEAY